jgi:hypothetical protein
MDVAREEGRVVADAQAVQAELLEAAELPGRPVLHWHSKRPPREIPYYSPQLHDRHGSTALTHIALSFDIGARRHKCIELQGTPAQGNPNRLATVFARPIEET